MKQVRCSMLLLVLLLGLLLSLLLTGCGGGGGGRTAQSQVDRIINQVQQMFLAGDASGLANLFVLELRDAAQAELEVVFLELNFSAFTITDRTYVFNADETAVVATGIANAEGTLQTPVGPRPFDDTYEVTVELRKVDDQWYIDAQDW